MTMNEDLRRKMKEHIAHLAVEGSENQTLDVDLGIVGEETPEGLKYGIYDFHHKEMVCPATWDNLYQASLSVFAAVDRGRIALVGLKATAEGGIGQKPGQTILKQVTPNEWDRITLDKHLLVLQRWRDDNNRMKFFCSNHEYLSRDYNDLKVLTQDLIAADRDDDMTEIITSDGWILCTGENIVPVVTDLVPAMDARYPMLFDLVDERFLWPVFDDDGIILAYIYADTTPRMAPELMVKCSLTRAALCPK